MLSVRRQGEVVTPIIIDLDSSLGATTAALLLAGLSPASIPGSWGGDLLDLRAWSMPLALPAGGLVLPFDVPLDTRLFGFAFYLQALEVDPGAAKGLSSTSGLELVIGG